MFDLFEVLHKCNIFLGLGLKFKRKNRMFSPIFSEVYVLYILDVVIVYTSSYFFVAHLCNWRL